MAGLCVRYRSEGYRRSMMLFVLVLLAALLAGHAAPAAAQGNVTLNVDRLESGGGSQPSGDAMTAYVSVRDENGVPVSGLGPQNFTIVEDQATSFPPDGVTVQVNPRAKLSVALVIDLSGTMRDQAMADAKAASQKLLETLLNEANDTDRAAFFGISGPVNIDDLAIHEDQVGPQGQVEIGFTNDRNKILNLVNTLEGKANVATPLYDALFRVAKITSLQAGPRAIIVLTDGQDPKVSKLAADDPISVANRNNIPIFPIGFGRGAINDTYLTRLAANTGGSYLKAAQASDISGLFQNILSKLDEQYVLTYNSRLARDEKPHAVIIRVESPKGKAYDDEIFRFKDVPTAPAAAAAAAGGAPAAQVAKPGQVPGSATTAGQTTEAQAPGAALAGVALAPTAEPFPQSAVTSARSFVNNKDNLPILIGVIVVLVLLLALIVFLLVRQSRTRSRVPEGATMAGAEYAYAGSQYASMPGIASEGTTAENPVGSAGGPAFEATLAGDAATGYEPTAYAPSPWPSSPGAPSEASPWSQPMPPAAAGGTVILRRPEQKVVAILVNRKNPQERFDVLPNTGIGRATENQVVLQDSTVSRQHAKIKLEKSTRGGAASEPAAGGGAAVGGAAGAEGGSGTPQFRLFDLASANHTYVNGVQVVEPVLLKDGDVIKFGEVEFVFKQLA